MTHPENINPPKDHLENSKNQEKEFSASQEIKRGPYALQLKVIYTRYLGYSLNILGIPYKTSQGWNTKDETYELKTDDAEKAKEIFEKIKKFLEETDSDWNELFPEKFKFILEKTIKEIINSKTNN
ncbi:MAG: hypothetical protein KatS3mg097_133 [Candidatus Parcubacteria bacterium]|nr:MAG: hypothetical protein KatS3mg097_133 [Candidatus Parcubacteria bacterium]